MSVNPLRGEAAVKIGDIEVVLSATMDDLARLSDALGNPMFPVLAQRLVGSEPSAIRAALRVFTVRGKAADGTALKRDEAVKAALAAYALSDNLALQKGMEVLLHGLMRPAKAEEAAEKN